MAGLTTTSQRGVAEFSMGAQTDPLPDASVVVSAFEGSLAAHRFDKCSATALGRALCEAEERLTPPLIDRLVRSALAYALANADNGQHTESVTNALQLAAQWIPPMQYNVEQRRELTTQLREVAADTMHAQFKLGDSDELGAQFTAAQLCMERLADKPVKASPQLDDCSFGGGEG